MAFVADDNPHSLRAHIDELGMDRVGEFVFSEKRYHILAFSISAEGQRRRKRTPPTETR